MRKTCCIALAAFISLSISPAVQADDSSPIQCYNTYLRALYYAKDVNAVKSFFPRAQRDLINKMTPQQKAAKLKEYKVHYVGNPKFTQKIEGTRAHVEGTGIGTDGKYSFPCKVNVDMVREDGYWRILSANISGSYGVGGAGATILKVPFGGL